MNKELKKIETDIIEEIKSVANTKSSNPLLRLESNSDKALRYSGVLYLVKKKMHGLSKIEKIKYNELFKKFRYDTSYLATKRAEIESFIFRDLKYMDMKNDLNEIKNLVELLENTVKIYQDKEYSDRLLAKAFIEGIDYKD